MHEKNIKNYIYVCPICLGKLEECKCFAFPLTLIQIDKNITKFKNPTKTAEF